MNKEYPLNDNNILAHQKTNRFFYLRILCTVSLIGSLFWLIIYLADYTGLNLLTLQEKYSSRFVFTGISALPMAIFSAFSGIGALLMWRLKKIGFYIYFLSQFLLFNYPLLFSGPEHFDLNELFFTTIFILLYGINLGNMKN
ncbi:MAG: hypothetical protein CVT94_16835 [Bacteroidetes bacterium HGW-Bacteroidetes-11]|nr:MAG: hypothetical protein CVT94_16835 [Bacteroidetes bacterium HGW-Bacteroidetes-11]